MSNDMYEAQKLAEEHDWVVDGPSTSAWLTLPNGDDLTGVTRFKFWRRASHPGAYHVVRALFDGHGNLMAANALSRGCKRDLQEGEVATRHMNDVRSWMRSS